ncbi:MULTISPECIES: SDR family oxidoreductase [unclassified Paraburkholderia]|uniref:SDR family oxidoreductase n=1 Tax=unclassified Paraburkholderia TaxID=2615204 RepID=UPI00161693B4|nr:MULTISPECIES: SDR family oxidoreductase [unclassified Paraburkholderia]
MKLDLEGRSVLVTGASQGIGAGIAKAFAREGCRLCLVARCAEKLELVAQEIVSSWDVDVDVLAIDMTGQGAIARVAEFARGVDVLINNAGSIPAGTLWDVDEAQWRSGWELKVFGYINLIRALYPEMAARRRGVILNNIGNGGENFDFNYIAGSTGNAALMAFTRALGGRSLADDGVRVVGVNPGPVETERVRKVLKGHAQRELGDESRFVELLKGYPLGRAATVDEIAELFVFLASSKSSYTSGTIVTVDGGITSRRSVSQT